MSTRQSIGNRYEIADLERGLLGRGGVGDIYRGTHLHTRRSVVIKALRPEAVTDDPDVVARFAHKGHLRELDHHSIVNTADTIPGRSARHRRHRPHDLSWCVL
jgi:serine/threonine-protein kinase